MNLTYDELRDVVSDLRDKIVGGRIRKIKDVSPDTIVFKIRNNSGVPINVPLVSLDNITENTMKYVVYDKGLSPYKNVVYAI